MNCDETREPKPKVNTKAYFALPCQKVMKNFEKESGYVNTYLHKVLLYDVTAHDVSPR